MRIGEVAARAGVRTSTIRYYESVGVLPEPERVAGQRRYTSDVLRELAVVDVAQRAGFTLAEIRELLSASGDGGPAYARLRPIAQQKLPAAEALIERAQAMRDWLQAASACECRTLDACALFDA